MTALYVTDYKTKLSVASRHVDVQRMDDDQSFHLERRLPLFKVERLAVVGRTQVSMRLVHDLLSRDIPVQVLSRSGKMLGAFSPLRDGDASIRIKQYQTHASEWALGVARSIAAAKVMNGRRMLQKTAGAGPAVDELGVLGKRASNAAALEEIRGIEGYAAALYFRELQRCFPPEMPFNGRNRRPPRDEVNALLSWTYTLVAQEIKGALMAEGLDPCIGVMHSVGYGRPSLALDIMEPFRSALCDQFVLRLANLKILTPAHFESDDETGGIRMTQEGMKIYFSHYEKRMERPFELAGSSAQITYRQVIREQAASYLAALRHGTAFGAYRMP